MAFAFGDGFSNVFCPTNPVLLINLVLTSLLLLLGLVIGYQ